MSQVAEALYESLLTEADLEALIGSSEDNDLECKSWFGLSETRVPILKAVCGLTNATGGVLVIGLQTTKAQGKNQPDVIEKLTPIPEPRVVGSQILDILLRGLQPGVAGIKSRIIDSGREDNKGYVVVGVPESEGLPNRIKQKDSDQFFVRMASGTLPMEYFQIADRFGRRPVARLTPVIGSDFARRVLVSPSQVERAIRLDVTNTGRGIARFPCLVLPKDLALSLSNNPFATDVQRWRFSQNADGGYSFRGSSDDVVYPGETLNVAMFTMRGKNLEGLTSEELDRNFYRKGMAVTWAFASCRFTVHTICEGTPITEQELELPALEHVADGQR